MSSNPSQVELWMLSTFVKLIIEPKVHHMMEFWQLLWWKDIISSCVLGKCVVPCYFFPFCLMYGSYWNGANFVNGLFPS